MPVALLDASNALQIHIDVRVKVEYDGPDRKCKVSPSSIEALHAGLREQLEVPADAQLTVLHWDDDFEDFVFLSDPSALQDGALLKAKVREKTPRLRQQHLLLPRAATSSPARTSIAARVSLVFTALSLVMVCVVIYKMYAINSKVGNGLVVIHAKVEAGVKAIPTAGKLAQDVITSISMANLKHVAKIISTKAKAAASINWTESACFPKCTKRVLPDGHCVCSKIENKGWQQTQGSYGVTDLECGKKCGLTAACSQSKGPSMVKCEFTPGVAAAASVVGGARHSHPASSRCSHSQFACSNGRCKPQSYVCDGYNDCGDHSDEASCHSHFCQKYVVANGSQIVYNVGYPNNQDCTWTVTCPKDEQGNDQRIVMYNIAVDSQSKGDAVHFNDMFSGRRWSYSGSMMPAPVISDYAYSGYYGRLAVTFKSGANAVQPQGTGPQNLALLKSPLKASLANRKAVFRGCGATKGNTAKFYVVLQPGQAISIGQTLNNFDSKHSIFWSTSPNPSSYPNYASGSKCVDDPDTLIMRMANSGSAARKLWFVVNTYSSITSTETFTLAWSISGTTKATRSPTNEPTRAGHRPTTPFAASFGCAPKHRTYAFATISSANHNDDTKPTHNTAGSSNNRPSENSPSWDLQKMGGCLAWEAQGNCSQALCTGDCAVSRFRPVSVVEAFYHQVILGKSSASLNSQREVLGALGVGVEQKFAKEVSLFLSTLAADIDKAVASAPDMAASDAEQKTLLCTLAAKLKAALAFEEALLPTQMKALNVLGHGYRSTGSYMPVSQSFKLSIENNITIQTVGTAIAFFSAVLDKVKLVC